MLAGERGDAARRPVAASTVGETSADSRIVRDSTRSEVLPAGRLDTLAARHAIALASIAESLLMAMPRTQLGDRGVRSRPAAWGTAPPRRRYTPPAGRGPSSAAYFRRMTT